MILFARHFHMGHRDGDALGKRLADGLLLHKLYLHAIFMVREKDRFVDDLDKKDCVGNVGVSASADWL